ncbi:type 1 glutamine amidotransferase [Paeniglutamicibacter sp.]|uniref:type 1 glutamine amidotransferase n=1 Tax=Paeniglutamicibacter sp. TaxID=1934391 RepID=UPI003989F998
MTTSVAAASEDERLRILVIQPDILDGPERLIPWMQDRGATINVIPGPSAATSSLTGYDGLVVMGGSMGDADTLQYPWLESIRQLLREAHDGDIPTLGICLGSQLMATALGGEVRIGSRGLEAGIARLTKTHAAATDPLLASLPQSFLAAEMHYDAITSLPPQASLLAGGEKYPNQVFRSRLSWGVQFHPEISPATYRTWIQAISSPSDGTVDQQGHGVDDVETLDPVIAASSAALIGNFVEVVRDNHGVAPVRNNASATVCSEL